MAAPKRAPQTSIAVRGLPPGVKQRLREQAARHGRSLEAEARELLVTGAVPQPPARKRMPGSSSSAAMRASPRSEEWT